MIVTIPWLKEHLKTNFKESEIIDQLTKIGLEVEGTKENSGDMSAFKIAKILRAEKHPNADKLKVTGNKSEDKIYHRHTGFPGGIYSTNFKKMQDKFPGRALEKAVKGMLPKGPLGYAMVKKLKVYAGDRHDHAAQQPQPTTI